MSSNFVPPTFVAAAMQPPTFTGDAMPPQAVAAKPVCNHVAHHYDDVSVMYTRDKDSGRLYAHNENDRGEGVNVTHDCPINPGFYARQPMSDAGKAKVAALKAAMEEVPDKMAECQARRDDADAEMVVLMKLYEAAKARRDATYKEMCDLRHEAVRATERYNDACA